MAEYELNIRDYWLLVKRRKKIVIFTTVIMTIFTIGLSIVQRSKPIYKATSSVKIEKTTNIAGLFTQAITVSPGDIVATQMIMIKSFPVMEKVIKKLGLVPEDIPSNEIMNNPEYAKMVLTLQSDIKVEREETTNIVNITVTSGDAEDAQTKANLTAEEFKKYSIAERNRQILERKNFVLRQVKIVEKRLRDAEDALSRFRTENDIVSLTTEQNNLLGRYSALAAHRDSLKAKIAGIQAELKLMKKNQRLSKKFFETLAGGNETPLILSLNTKLTNLSIERGRLLINFLPDHPKVKEIDNQIANIKQKIKNQLLGKLDALKREVAIAEGDLKKLKGDVVLLPRTALRLKRLEREVTLNEKLLSLLKSKRQETLIEEAGKVEDVSIIRHALKPSAPTNPSTIVGSIFLGSFVGVVLGIVAAFIRESLETSIGAIEDVEGFLHVPVLGLIPSIDFEEEKSELQKTYPGLDDKTYDIYSSVPSHFLPKSSVSESYKALRTNISFLQRDKDIKAILFASASIDEGKTTTLINVAITIAQMGMRVLLVDADLRNHSIHRYFGLDIEPGFSDAIMGKVNWKSIVRNITDMMLGKLRVDDILSNPGMDNINILTAGRSHGNPSEFLNSTSVETIIKEMKDNYDFVLFDTPPVLPVSDALILANKVDGTILVYLVGKTPRSALLRAKLSFDNVNGKVVGVALNGVTEAASPDLQYMGYGGYYHHEYKEEKSMKDQISLGFKNIREKLNSILKKKDLPKT